MNFIRRLKAGPMEASCFKGAGNRHIQVSHEGNRLKKEATDRLLSEKGIGYRKKRCYDVVPVFGKLKQNKGFRRFMLRGKEKAALEIGLLAIAHNLKKKAASKGEKHQKNKRKANRPTISTHNAGCQQ
ncbi:MAG: hypothetical protein EOP49_07660 [Sphingobacteriales bacterium]|nr:MAG: hypothetical protein EOP49_07660 [Sphingobacteriales bacterium]